MKFLNFLNLAGPAGCCLLLLSGCGAEQQPWGAVSGRITLAGQPVEPALVLFSNPDNGIEITGETDDEGRFTLQTDRIAGLPVGEYRVAVTPRPEVVAPADGMSFSGTPLPSQATKIPAAAQTVGTTHLVAVVKEGDNNFELELQP